MSAAGWFQLVALVVVLAVTVAPLGRYLAHVYSSTSDSRVERVIYRWCRVDPRREQRWNVYASSLLAFSVVGFVMVYAIQRLQSHLPLNPTGVGDVSPQGAFSVAVSFVTNTNWQWYSGELTMSHLTQMLGLTVQNFVSAAAGMAIAIALIRGIARRNATTLGNFWVDMVRTVTRVLLPLSLVMAVALMSQGVIQNFHGSTTATPIDSAVTHQVAQQIPGGPVASQEAIKQLGTNGGGFFNANSAHPFENPNGVSGFVELWAILALPFALAIAYGHLVGSRRQARTLLLVMAAIWLAFSVLTVFAEQGGNRHLDALGVDQSVSSIQAGGNTEGKDIRFGPATCGVWAASTTGTSNGSVDCMHDSFTPLGGMVPMLHMMLGEVSPGGVGVGLMGVLMYALLAVFIAGLMVGRTPEYLGKKIQAAEMKLVVLYLIAMPVALLGLAAASTLIGSAKASLTDTGAHGLSALLYNFSSAANNNGSAFASMNAGTDWYTITQGIAMLVGRFFLIIPALAIGGSLARKQRVPATAGTFPTDTPLFAGLLVGVVAIIAGLTFFPALALGPIMEHLTR